MRRTVAFLLCAAAVVLLVPALFGSFAQFLVLNILLLALFALLFPFEFTACLVRHIAQLVKEAALVEHRRAVDEGEGLS